MKRFRVHLFCLACLALLLFDTWGNTTQVVSAAPLPPPEGRGTRDGRYRPLSPESGESLLPEETAVSDLYGYTRELVTVDWIDAEAGGSQVSFSDLNNSFAGPIPLGFNFPFYEYAYSELYISTDGFLTFGAGAISPRNEFLPQDTPPNNLLAVFWDDLSLKIAIPDDAYSSVCAPGVTPRLYYRSNPSAPEPYFVVEWRQVCHRSSKSYLTFEAVLYRSGDIRFQYQVVPEGASGATVGVEDADGIDGLLYQYNGAGVKSGSALLFKRPAPGFRVKAFPAYGSSFAAGRQAVFTANFRNTGNPKGNPADIYDIEAVVTGSRGLDWSIALLNDDGDAYLSDSDGDGKPDTGPLAAGHEIPVRVKLSAPPGAIPGDYINVSLTARSSRDPDKAASAVLQASLPAPFAQAFSNDQTGLRMRLVGGGSVKEFEAGNWFSGNTLAFASIGKNNFVYAWEQSAPRSNLGYAIISWQGRLILSPRDLTAQNPREADGSIITDRSPVIAAAPGGRTAIAWLRESWKIFGDEYKLQSNLFFAILDADGSFLTEPKNVTANIGWRGAEDKNIPTFYSPKLASLGGTAFVLGWMDQRSQAGGETSDIVYTIFTSDGQKVKSSAPLTNSVPGGTQYLDPAFTELGGNRFLVVYSEWETNSESYSLYYQVLGDNGATVHGKTQLKDGNGSGADAVQLSGGNILLAWTGQVNSRIAYITLNGVDFLPLHPVVELQNPNSRLADYVSVTTDREGRGILTWMDAIWNDYLYYSLIDGSGSLLTPPMYFYRGQSSDPIILTSYSGQGNAPFSPTWSLYLPDVKP